MNIIKKRLIKAQTYRNIDEEIEQKFEDTLDMYLQDMAETRNGVKWIDHYGTFIPHYDSIHGDVFSKEGLEKLGVALPNIESQFDEILVDIQDYNSYYENWDEFAVDKVLFYYSEGGDCSVEVLDWEFPTWQYLQAKFSEEEKEFLNKIDKIITDWVEKIAPKAEKLGEIIKNLEDDRDNWIESDDEEE